MTGKAEGTSLIEAYFNAWNAHDAAALEKTFTPNGTYSDPTTESPILASELVRVVTPLTVAFPDLSFEYAPPTRKDESVTAVEWTLRGTNTAPWGPGINATGLVASVRGVTVFERAEGAFESVRSYFDQKAFFESFGLMVLAQPRQQANARFGYSMRLPSGNTKPPGVIALTWIEGANETEKERIRAHSRENVKDFLAEPGFISIVTGFTGLRGFTVTAWEDEVSMKRALSKHHALAMKELFGENFVASVWTSVWTPTRMNRIWVRCTECGTLEDVNDDHRNCSHCSAPLPTRPAFW